MNNLYLHLSLSVVSFILGFILYYLIVRYERDKSSHTKDVVGEIVVIHKDKTINIFINNKELIDKNTTFVKLKVKHIYNN